MLIVDVEKCTGCKVCENVCPFIAIHVNPETKLAEVDELTCTLCGSCVNACRFDALRIERKAPSEEELAKYKGVFIWCETESKDGQIVLKKVAKELIGKGKELANSLGETITAVLLGASVKHLTEEIDAIGVNKVIIAEHELLAQYSTDGFTTVISTLITKHKPSIMLFGATPSGRDLAPRIAGRLALGLTADCTGLTINDDRQLVQTRPAFGGNIMASILSPYRRPQMATVRPNVFPEPEAKDSNKVAEIEVYEPKLKKSTIRTKILENIITKTDDVNIEDANIIVSAGRGIGSAENLKLVKELADELGGVTAGSRAIVELGWIPQPKQVGQSGRTVAPNVYIALGISGAIQHLVGMKSSDTIIAINNDPEAPIFKVADFGIVGDLFQIVPELISQVKAYKETL